MRVILAGRTIDCHSSDRPASILLISRAAATPTLRAYQSPIGAIGIIFVLLLMIGLSTERARAEWTRAGSNDGSVYYVDRDSIVRNGSHAWMWNLTDYRDVQSWEGHTFLSSSAKFEYDCSGARSRVIVEDGYSEHMGNGQKAYTVKGPRPWQQAMPGTRSQEKLRIACDP